MARPKREDRTTVAESPLAIRLTAPEREVLNELVRLRQEELGHEAKVSQGSYIRALIAREAKAKGIAVRERGQGANEAAASATSPRAKRAPRKR